MTCRKHNLNKMSLNNLIQFFIIFVDDCYLGAVVKSVIHTLPVSNRVSHNPADLTYVRCEGNIILFVILLLYKPYFAAYNNKIQHILQRP